jgi:hypothetical protein
MLPGAMVDHSTPLSALTGARLCHTDVYVLHCPGSTGPQATHTNGVAPPAPSPHEDSSVRDASAPPGQRPPGVAEDRRSTSLLKKVRTSANLDSSPRSPSPSSRALRRSQSSIGGLSMDNAERMRRASCLETQVRCPGDLSVRLPFDASQCTCPLCRAMRRRMLCLTRCWPNIGRVPHPPSLRGGPAYLGAAPAAAPYIPKQRTG